MKNDHYDLVVIGGGINGTAIALEATARGLKTLLCEKNDLASATSSASTKLIHGGLRYLAAFELSLVMESLKDRKNLLEHAPHLVKPLRFYIPFKQKKWPYWQTKLGLWFYHSFAKLPDIKQKPIISDTNHIILNRYFRHFLNFQDCYTDDARLVIANAKKAHDLGADILTYTKLISAKQQNHQWELILENQFDLKQIKTISTQTVVNASGPWVENIHTQLFNCKTDFELKLIQGSHLIINKIIEGSHAYLLPTSDNRVIFILPYLDKFNLIGTTDTDIPDSTSNNKKFDITQQEITYLLKEINPYLSSPLNQENILNHWSGARALPIKKNVSSIKPSEISREYKLEWVETHSEGPYLLSVWGGKLTTHRSLAVHAISILKNKLHTKLKTNSSIYHQYLNSQNNQPFDPNHILDAYDFLPDYIKRRLIFNYGQDCLEFLKNCTHLDQLGIHFGQGLYEAEINYLITHEWAQTLEDILLRRTKMGLLLTTQEKTKLQSWFEKRHGVQFQASESRN
jgi:glycerol-3-phosphate dehydrogenase